MDDQCKMTQQPDYWLLTGLAWPLLWPLGLLFWLDNISLMAIILLERYESRGKGEGERARCGGNIMAACVAAGATVLVRQSIVDGYYNFAQDNFSIRS